MDTKSIQIGFNKFHKKVIQLSDFEENFRSPHKEQQQSPEFSKGFP